MSGVQRADILGERTFAMRIWLKPERMAARGISPAELREALARNNYLSALGRTKGSMVSVNLIANTDLRTAEEFQQLVVKEKDGVVVRLGEIADVVLGAENYDEDVRFNGQTAVFMGIWVLPTANSLDVIQRVRTEMPGIQAQLPAGMTGRHPLRRDQVHRGRDQRRAADADRDAAHRRGRDLPVPRARCAPSSSRSSRFRSRSIGAVFLMLAAGFTINLLTLLAIVLSVGLVVDDAIVMVENVERHLHAGLPPVQAALTAARELVGPIIAMTITLAAVYAPVGIQGGLTGALFREFAFTLAGAVIVSGVVALTLSPMMGAKPPARRRQRARLRRLDQPAVRHGPPRLRADARRDPAVPAGGAGAVGDRRRADGALLPAVAARAGADRGSGRRVLDRPGGAQRDHRPDHACSRSRCTTSIASCRRPRASSRSRRRPAASAASWPSRGASARRRRSSCCWTWRARCRRCPGIRAIPLTPPPLPGGGDFPVDLVIASPGSPERLAEVAQQLVGKAFASGMFLFADSDLKYDQPQTEVVFDRDKLRRRAST